MSISLKCTGCKCTLKLRDELAGRKVKCPRCQTVLLVPEAEEEEFAEVAAEKKQAEKPAPRKPTGRTGRVQREEPAASRKQKMRIGRDDEEEAAPPVSPSQKKKKKESGKESKYKPCPQCGAEGATRVKWTSWGSFYGPRLVSHVSCPECAYCYNGKTGRSNGLAIALFVVVPLIGILGILGGIFYVLISRGYLKF